MPIAKKHRLHAAAYHGAIRLAVTACIEDRRKVFRDNSLVNDCVEILSDAASAHGCKVPVYCFMPDHLHMIVEGLDESSRVRQVVERFKFKSAVALARLPGNTRWQESYYDHKIRKSDDWRAQALYIFANPIRARLVVDPFEYEFTGSIGYELRDVFEGLFW